MKTTLKKNKVKVLSLISLGLITSLFFSMLNKKEADFSILKEAAFSLDIKDEQLIDDPLTKVHYIQYLLRNELEKKGYKKEKFFDLFLTLEEKDSKYLTLLELYRGLNETNSLYYYFKGNYFFIFFFLLFYCSFFIFCFSLFLEDIPIKNKRNT